MTVRIFSWPVLFLVKQTMNSLKRVNGGAGATGLIRVSPAPLNFHHQLTGEKIQKTKHSNTDLDFDFHGKGWSFDAFRSSECTIIALIELYWFCCKVSPLNLTNILFTAEAANPDTSSLYAWSTFKTPKHSQEAMDKPQNRACRQQPQSRKKCHCNGEYFSGNSCALCDKYPTYLALVTLLSSSFYWHWFHHRKLEQ